MTMPGIPDVVGDGNPVHQHHVARRCTRTHEFAYRDYRVRALTRARLMKKRFAAVGIDLSPARLSTPPPPPSPSPRRVCTNS